MPEERIEVQTSVVETAPVQEVAPSEPVQQVDPWTGELTSLQSQPWWMKIPDDARGHVLPGIEKTYKGWQAAHTKKSQELAESRKSWEAEKSTWETERDARKKELDEG